MRDTVAFLSLKNSPTIILVVLGGGEGGERAHPHRQRHASRGASACREARDAACWAPSSTKTRGAVRGPRAPRLEQPKQRQRRRKQLQALELPRSARCSTGSAASTSVTEQQAAGAGNDEGQAERSPAAADTLQLRVQLVDSIDQVPRHEWDALVAAQPETNPFLKWSFLHALEASGSAVPQEGWGPRHVTVRDHATGELLGAAPMYLKGHSYGEYVFDNSWAQFAHLHGHRYYPKLQVCVPFTPVTGPRLLVAPGGPREQLVAKALAQTLATLTDELGVSSLHVTFPTAQEWSSLGALGFQRRRGIQYWWQNDSYASFDDFLGRLKQGKRKNIRQERKSVAKQGLSVRRLAGGEVSASLWDRFYGFYTSTVDKRWGSRYLTREFFHMLGSEVGDDVLLVVAEERGEPVAAALNLVGSHCIFGRNWGCVPGREFKHLHFELCYYQAIEEAIARKLPRVEAGAQGEHKLQRGYLPAFTYSAHYMADPLMRSAVGRFLEREAQQLQYTWQALTLEGSPYKEDHTLEYLMSSMSSLSSMSSADDADTPAAAPRPLAEG